jgi:hypothetical protein
MAVQLDLKSKRRKTLGSAYARRLSVAEGARTNIMHDTWIRAHKYFEGKSRRMDWPWPGASNAVMPITPTHTNALKARLHTAGTALKPVYLLKSILPEDTELVSGLTAGGLRDVWQHWSQHVEDNVIDNDELMDRVTRLQCKYGDAFVYLAWVNKPIKDFHWMPALGEYQEEIRDLYDHPVAYVIHGKNTYFPVEEEEPVDGKYFGFDEFYDIADIELLVRNEEWTKEEGEEILSWLKQRNKENPKEDENWYRTREDGALIGRADDELDELRRRDAGLEDRDETHGLVRLVRVFAREDLDKDGYEEEIEFLIHRESEMVPFIKYTDLWHGERPITQFPFEKRDGVGYSIGVPEMLFNLQQIMNRLVRDHLNNNMVQNTKAFLARAGGPIEDKMRVHPGRIIFVDDLEADFKPIDMGTGRPVDVVNVLPIIQDWAERRTGVNDATLGQMSPKRAPATSTLALIEQSNKGTDHIIRRMAKKQRRLWKQCMALYVQFHTDSEELQNVLGPNRAAMLEAAWRLFDPKMVRETLAVDCQVSTASLNNQTRRQEAVALFGQTQMAYQAITNTAIALAQVPDPTLKQLFVYQLQGFNKALGRIYDTFEIKDQTYFNPDFLEILQNVPPEGAGSLAGQQDGVGGQGPGNQMAEAMQLFGQLGGEGQPVNPTGRPDTGAPRNPSETLPQPE